MVHLASKNTTMKKSIRNPVVFIAFALLLMTAPASLQAQRVSAQPHFGLSGFQTYEQNLKNEQVSKAMIAKSRMMAAGQQVALKSFSTGKVKLEESIHSKADSVTGATRQEFKEAYTYNEAGRMIHRDESEWSDSLNSWQLAYKDDITYNDRGNISHFTEYSQDAVTGLWNPSFRMEYAYDTVGKPNLAYYYEFDLPTQSWENYMTDIYYYNDHSTMSSMITYSRNETDGRWETYCKDQFNRTHDGVLTSFKRSFWSSGDNKWSTVWNVALEYDSVGNLIRDVLTVSDGPAGTFNEKRKILWSYDYTTDLSLVCLPPLTWMSDAEQLFNKPTAVEDYNYNGHDWVLNRTGVYHYSGSSSSLPVGYGTEGIKVFPNPASGSINVELPGTTDPASIELFDSAGRKILSQKFTGHTTLNLDDKAANVVFYVVVSGGTKQSGKILIK